VLSVPTKPHHRMRLANPCCVCHQLRRRRKHGILAAIASQALTSSLTPTSWTHLLAVSALLDSMRPHEAAKDVALCRSLLAPPITESGTRCSTEHRELRHTLEMIAAATHWR
jgi:leucine-rich PPR motif-containing protein, mitochondrial